MKKSSKELVEKVGTKVTRNKVRKCGKVINSLGKNVCMKLAKKYAK